MIGHEIAHVLEGHSNERVSQGMLAQSAMSAVEAAVDAGNPMHGQMLGLLGAGVQVGVLLPFGREHENEADLLGLEPWLALALTLEKVSACGAIWLRPKRDNHPNSCPRTLPMEPGFRT